MGATKAVASVGTLGTGQPEPTSIKLDLRFRADIQALRAIAVLTVVVFHYWPSALPGGYVGVDAFFVVSGYLITSHLLREVDSTGTVSLRRFWARRATPAPPGFAHHARDQRRRGPRVRSRNSVAALSRRDAAAALYYVNWQLAADAVDYFAAEGTPSVAQHFWSLSTEEQFYLVWPMLVVGAAFVGRRRDPIVRRRVIAGMLVLVTIASLLLSIVMTRSAAGRAYYISPTRAWEFGAGALLAFVPSGRDWLSSGHVRRWHGGRRHARLVCDRSRRGVAIPRLDRHVAGTRHRRRRAGAWRRSVAVADADRRHRPVQYLGDVSYSWYLWHWPVLIVAPYVLDRELSHVDLSIALLLSLGIAALSLRFVERPFRTRRIFVGQGTILTLTASAVAMAIVIAITMFGIRRIENLEATASSAAEATAQDECFGAAASPIARGAPSIRTFRSTRRR